MSGFSRTRGSDVHNQEEPAPSHLLAWHGRHSRAAAARLDDSRAHAARADRREAAAASRDSSTSRTARSWTSGRRPPSARASSSRRSSSRSSPSATTLNVVIGLGHKAADTTAVHSLSPTTWLSGVRPKATQGVDAFAGVTADQIAAQAIGQDNAAAVDGARHRGSLRPHRLVRPRLRLHLHEHAVVADAGNAAADGDQSAQGLRADVRPGRQRRPSASRASRRTAASSTRSPRKRPPCSCSSGPPIARR